MLQPYCRPLVDQNEDAGEHTWYSRRLCLTPDRREHLLRDVQWPDGMSAGPADTRRFISMLDILQVVALMLVTLASVPALAHALELPGKMRLTKEAYFAAQTIYYPGFTIAGSAEPLAIIATFVLLLLTPQGGAAYALTFVALLGLIVMHAVYWLFTHSVNKVWLQGERLSAVGTGFFSVGSASSPDMVDWRRLRDRWEYSHVARAGLVVISLIALVVAVA
jgi:hypothetical protein